MNDSSLFQYISERHRRQEYYNTSINLLLLIIIILLCFYLAWYYLYPENQNLILKTKGSNLISNTGRMYGLFYQTF